MTTILYTSNDRDRIYIYKPCNYIRGNIYNHIIIRYKIISTENNHKQLINTYEKYLNYNLSSKNRIIIKYVKIIDENHG